MGGIPRSSANSGAWSSDESKRRRTRHRWIEKFFSSGIGLGVFTVAINIDDTLLAPSSK